MMFEVKIISIYFEVMRAKEMLDNSQRNKCMGQQNARKSVIN
jgi:hypothetical protein